ncbi:polysaccharide biosynthesis/export family protein [Cellulophaga sp. HaHaR_3_176]|uniref:polysaccharide biosynthesis/export family protein n=1 Tax=Cellulophaga sp. HaHaR_3_176 TaxID=1942464 RepID=UPI001C1FB984|nr:polysaccharide biosynthesis/export family protein [Cellulophaga sp. HaHaR_3_176]QWX85663.1 polysaccharide biosynthesis/export family protein [Cellulophaga sp. HaHaR_3_176]
MNRPFILLSLIALSTLLFVSCGSKKNVVYFQDAGNFETIVEESHFVPKFKVDDEVSIFVSTLNPEASAPFNLYRGGSNLSSLGGSVSSSQREQVNYLIDQDGTIDFPVIGKLKIVGLSSDELRNLLIEKLSDYLKDPIINIRLNNFTVSILGEVSRPGTYQVNGEQITLLEAIGLAGDLTIKGKRDNILVIRNFDGTFVHNRIDLTSKEAMKSPVYYLTQNDVVYIEPNKSAITSSSLDNRATIAISIASVLITSSVLILTRNN